MKITTTALCGQVLKTAVDTGGHPNPIAPVERMKLHAGAGNESASLSGIALGLGAGGPYNLLAQLSANERRPLNNHPRIPTRHPTLSTLAVLFGLAAPLGSNASSKQ